MPRPLDQVNILQGTNSRLEFSSGNTLPLTGLPHALGHWSPQTSQGLWFFDPHRPLLLGIRSTRQPSPWIGDYGAFSVMGQSGPRRLVMRERQEPWILSKSLLQPHRFRTELPADGTVIEMAPFRRGAIFEFTFPPDRPRRVIVQGCEGLSFASLEGSEVHGWSKGAAGGAPESFCHHFVLRFSRPPVAGGAFSEEGAGEGKSLEGKQAGAWAEFAPDEKPLTVWIATSFISLEQARVTLAREVQPFSLEEGIRRAGEEWDAALGAFEVESSEEDLVRTFSSCLYRTMLFPHFLTEVDEGGRERHWSPYSGQVHSGEGVTDNGFWDTYRTVYPLYSLIHRPALSRILQGWVASYEEGGWFPQWASPGYRACMVGTHIDAVFADAEARGVKGYDREKALEGMLKHASQAGDPAGAWGRIGVEDYLRLGWVPCDRHHESVCRSLDYAYDDWCLAQFAQSLGQEEEAAKALARTSNWRHLYDSQVGFMRGKTESGQWLEPWDEFRWGDPYVEGSAWQALWGVPHDIPGLIEVMGGEEAFVARLTEMMATPPEFRVGAYGVTIHEMTEMACAGFGQYAHSNQPVHHALYLFAHAGRPDLTRFWVNRVLRELYSPGDFPGDEDNGEMAAWFVLSALGLYPTCPGRPAWTLGGALFDRITLRREGSPDLVVEKGSPEDQPRWDGQILDSVEVSQERVEGGGRLILPSLG